MLVTRGARSLLARAELAAKALCGSLGLTGCCLVWGYAVHHLAFSVLYDLGCGGWALWVMGCLNVVRFPLPQGVYRRHLVLDM